MNKWCALRTRNKWYKELEVRSDNLSNALTSVQSDSMVIIDPTYWTWLRVYEKICPTLRSERSGLLVCDSPKSTNTPLKSINPTSQIIHPMETSQKSTLQLFPTSTVSSEVFLAKLFQSLENENDLKIPDERSSLSLREYCEQNNLDYSSLKMLKDCSVMTTEKLSAPSSPRLMSWGMTVNGKCLTAKITECHRTGSECSLSDILEEQPDQKYFLSDLAMKNIFEKQTSKGARLHLQDETQEGKTVWVTISSEHFEPTKIENDSEKWKNESVQPFQREPERTEADNQWSEFPKQLDSDSATQGGGIL